MVFIGSIHHGNLFPIFAGMYSAPELVLKYIRWYLHAANGKGHGVHSPFVFDFIKYVKNKKLLLTEYQDIEALRNSLLAEKKSIEVEDFGAGSAKLKPGSRQVSKMAASSLKPKKFAQLIFRIVKYYRPVNILELGTSFGITTAYMAKAFPAANIISLEGAPAVAAIARKNMDTLHLTNVEIRQGSFEVQLPRVPEAMADIDLAFIDGHHLKAPTLQYFHFLRTYMPEEGIIIFDDIHWSAGMEAAWAEIKSHPSVTLSLDLFFIGIVFFRKDFKHKQHFSLRF
ncbi:MAG: class I SAM-dependent methyltransferase [Ferruginibacter sp.]